MMKKTNIIAATMAVVLMMAGVFFVQQDTKAAEKTTTQTVQYEQITVPTDSKVPVKDGCVFGGWYEETGENTYTALSVAPDAGTSAIAKWVPAYVLSVKTQIVASASEEDGEYATLRVMTSVDCKDYKKVGFDIYLNNKKDKLTDENGNDLETTKVYGKIKTINGDMPATQVFGEASKGGVAAWWLTDIDDAHDASIIYVRPYWITLDGTKVSGHGKYVHVEDGYLGYISVPVNIFIGQDMAAGKMDVAIENSSLEFVDCKPGRIFETEMKCSASEGGVVQSVSIIGNGSIPGNYNNGEVLYANLRFKKPTGDSKYNFTMNEGMFCKWDETEIEGITAWDYQY